MRSAPGKKKRAKKKIKAAHVSGFLRSNSDCDKFQLVWNVFDVSRHDSYQKHQ